VLNGFQLQPRPLGKGLKSPGDAGKPEWRARRQKFETALILKTRFDQRHELPPDNVLLRAVSSHGLLGLAQDSAAQ